jgi:hypothetical protein
MRRKAIQSLRPSDFATAFGRAEARWARGDERPKRPQAEAWGYQPWGTWKQEQEQKQKQKQIPFGNDKKEKPKRGRVFFIPANEERSRVLTRDTPPFHDETVKGWATPI